MVVNRVFAYPADKIDPALDELFISSSGKPSFRPVGQAQPGRKVTLELGETNGTEPDSEELEEPTSSEAASQDLGTENALDEEDSAAESQPDLGNFSEDFIEGDGSDGSVIEPIDQSDDAILQSRASRRKRKRTNDEPELEDLYLAKLSRQAANSALGPRKATIAASNNDEVPGVSHGLEEIEPADEGNAMDEDSNYIVPQHETQNDSVQKAEMDKATRTCFLGNVSTDAIRSKDSMKQLTNHLESGLADLPKEKDGKPHKIESFRFRSVAFSTTSMPRKAAFAKKELMDATTRSTNAYVVYTTARAAREAVKRLNGTVILDRHLRVDGVAHPSPVDHRRCVFVGNLGFVDDESLIHAAENHENQNEPEASHSKKRKSKNKPPSDVEEGLWRIFSTLGPVESVRVVRDKTTRVGKGIAYVQFQDQVAAEKALALDGKAFPPMLPRELRVTRAKKPTKTAGATNRKREQMQAAIRRSESQKGKSRNVYNPRIDHNARTSEGRVRRLLGRAGAAQLIKGTADNAETETETLRRPEDFVFEGHRAKATEGKRTMNLKPVKSGKKKLTKPNSRSSKRGAAFKAAGRRK